MDQSPHDGFTRFGDALPKQSQRTDTCPEHGEFTARNLFGKIWSKCPECDRIVQEKGEARRREEEAQRKREQDAAYLQHRLRHSGLVGRFLDATFENFTADTPPKRKAMDACRAFVDRIGVEGTGGLWLIGPPGTGKTHLGSAMVNAIIREKRMQARILSAREIVRMLRATWRKHEPKAWHDNTDGPEFTTEEEAIDGLAKTPLLVLDEIGVGFGSDSEMVQLFDVLDLRYKLSRPTVLLSNLTAAELKPALGDRAYDRLREGSTLVPCSWASHRSSGSRA